MVESQLYTSHGRTIALKMYNLLSMKFHCCNKCIQFNVWMQKFINDLASVNWIVSRCREAHAMCVCYSGWIPNPITFRIFTSRECNTFIMQRIQTCAKSPFSSLCLTANASYPEFHVAQKPQCAHNIYMCVICM